ncbi:MAG: glutamate formimidoyltransferase [Chloroflexota bacterium]
MIHQETNRSSLVEAVPNFSEGRRSQVVDKIAQAIQRPGVRLLNRTSDWDHNRSVLTVAGPPAAVVEGLYQAIDVAAQEIDLFEHQGVHPRLGATDVVPLIPIREFSLADCVTLANQLGARVGEELGLPVYLYEAAATQSARRNLADVRRGQFEGLVEEISQPHRKPDFGPVQVGSAGAVIIGARQFLIAYNVYLETGDVQIAKIISKRIRESSGGMLAVKALGLLVEGRAQVSMNLVDFQVTGLPSVMEAIEQMASDFGTRIHSSELIGLLPQQALLDVASHYLKLPSLVPDQIIEYALHK